MTDAKPQTRQQLYDRIRESSKDEVILEEMVRLGYWPAEKDQPNVPGELIKRRGELERELRDLLAKQRRYADPQAAVKEMHKKRMTEALERREQTRIKHETERHEKALAWHKLRNEQIVYLGAGVSQGLGHTQSDTDRLARHPLPAFHEAGALAEAMGIDLSELRFLAYARKTSHITHYRHFEIAKKTGGTRRISTPMARLKRAQYWILDNILAKVGIHEAAHGFVPGRSIVSNAKVHTGAAVVVNMDLQDFFPSIGYKRIKGLYRKLGYSEQIATILALLCSEADIEQVQLDGKDYYVATGERRLPQGAPTSPAISNLICRQLDARIDGTAKKLGYRYTRYADDMSFSADREGARKLGKLFWRLGKIVEEEGFVIRPDKTRIMRANNRQEVTGIVVNEKPSLDRKTLKRFRAVLHQIDNDGPEGKTWGNGGDLFAAIDGYAHYVAMVDPDKGRGFVEQVKRIKQRHGLQTKQTPPGALNKYRFRDLAAAGGAPRENWWQAEPAPAPELVLPEPKKKPARARNEAARESVEAGESETPASTERSETPDFATGVGRFFKYLFWVIVIGLIALRFFGGGGES